MSNSIWKNPEETPKDFCDVVLANFRTGSCCVFLSPFHNVSFDYDKWCYITDLIAQAGKAERVQKALIQARQDLGAARKALDVAVDALKEIDKTRSVANHKIGTQDKTLNSGIVFCWTTPDEIHNTLEQITALEQKDVK